MSKKRMVFIQGVERYPNFHGYRVYYSWVVKHERHTAQVFVNDEEDVWAVIREALESKQLKLVGQEREV